MIIVRDIRRFMKLYVKGITKPSGRCRPSALRYVTRYLYENERVY